MCAGQSRLGRTRGPLLPPLAVYQAVDDVLRRYEGELDDKGVVDITSPVVTETYAPLRIEAGSVTQEIAARVPGAKVVKAFNTTFAGALVEGHGAGEQLDVLLASDDGEAKDVVSRLAADGGMHPIDARAADARAPA